MTKPDFITAPNGRRLAYHQTEGTGVGVVFLGGFKSDMAGTKALDLEARAIAQNRPFLRFDYSGHGQSSGNSSKARSVIGIRMRTLRSRL